MRDLLIAPHLFRMRRDIQLSTFGPRSLAIDVAPSKHSIRKVRDFLAMTINELKYSADGTESDCKLRSFSEVRLTHGGTADKCVFLREPISVRKSLSCVLHLRYELGRKAWKKSGWFRVSGGRLGTSIRGLVPTEPVVSARRRGRMNGRPKPSLARIRRRKGCKGTR
jgi:hypothetical protein